MIVVGPSPKPLRHDDRPVLATVPLRPGFDRADLSRYGDESWDLAPAVFRENTRLCHITAHFGAIDDAGIRNVLRQFLYARLNVALPGYRGKLPPTGLRQLFNRTRRFLEFVRGTLGACDLAHVDRALVDRYAREVIAARTRGSAVNAHLLEVVADLHAYRDHMPGGGLTFEPWRGRSPYIVVGHQHSRENRTPRIPEAVITPLLAWSLRYVSNFAPDILAARAELTRLEARRDTLIAADAGVPLDERRARHRKRLTAFLNRCRRERRGVPIWTTAHNGTVRRDPATGAVTPSINAHLLHLHMGIDARTEPKLHVLLDTGEPELIEAAAAKFGLEIGGMDTPIAEDPMSQRPWRPRFDAKTLAHEERMLQAAAYLVCAYLTGMRDCEVQAMRPGCLSLTRDEDGGIMRHRVRSTAYKSRSSRGTPAAWVTIAPVAEAINVIEQLAVRAARARGVDTLWPVLSLKTGTKSHVSSEIVRQLNAYRDHLNALFGTDQPVVPPGPDGVPWRITTRQFRRTIAWHIANRPFGTIAGMIQYKHASVAAFEGYAGSSASGFRAEVETQRALGQLDDVLAYFDERSAGASPSGPAGPRVARTLDVTRDELQPLPGMIADRARLRTLLASLARTLHVGVLADCFFDPSTALCLKRVTQPEAKAPHTALCEPTRCPNACITGRHRPAWASAAQDAKAMLREKRLSEPQRLVLEQDLTRFEAVLNGIGPDP